MAVQNILHMTGGQGETSYALNSQIQRVVIFKAKPILEDRVIDLYRNTLPKSFTVADLGCSLGPNSLLVISEIIYAVHSICQELGESRIPEFQVMLNDLPGNDFNTIFQSIPYFLQNLKKEKGDEQPFCFISGVPGSFYGRLFPSNSLNLVHSSYSLQILSQMTRKTHYSQVITVFVINKISICRQVPSGLEDNKNYIYINNDSPQSAIEAYFSQFRKDFTLFLASRSHEVVPGGRMVITVIGRRSPDRTSDECCYTLELVAKCLLDMVSKGLVEEDKLDSFHWPAYFASPEEVTMIVEDQGSFHLDLVEVFDVDWDANYHLHPNKDSGYSRGRYVSDYTRAVMESVFASHFGAEIIEELFQKYAELVDEHYLVKGDGNFVNLVICMTKKG